MKKEICINTEIQTHLDTIALPLDHIFHLRIEVQNQKIESQTDRTYKDFWDTTSIA